MAKKNSGYIHDIDRMIEQTPLADVLAHYGKEPAKEQSGEHRMECVFNSACQESQYGQLTVKLDDPARRIYCHSCGVRGNLLTLIHGLERGSAPSGGRLRGEEFKAAVQTLRAIADLQEQVAPRKPSQAPKPIEQRRQPAEKSSNTPLIRHDKEAARALADLHEELVTDPSRMSPESAKYVCSRPWMTEELMREWGVGWIPGNGRSLFRKNYFVYTHRNERGEVVSYSGRDLSFEENWTKWTAQGRPEGKKPSKHRFVSGFLRGVELYGGQAARLKEAHVRESLARYGVVIVEGMNDVLRMETLGVAAVGLMSNKVAPDQLEKLTRFARSAGGNRVLLLPDCNAEGEAGFSVLMWKLSERGVSVRLGWSSGMFEGQMAGREPESLTEMEWKEIDG